MDIKNILKNIKLQESTISMVMGVLVIVIIGIFGINYFSQKDKEQKSNWQSNNNNEESVNISPTGAILPTKHIIAENESLWSISEKYYGTGYNWVDIREANNLANPNQISVGTEIIIPDVEPRKIEKTVSPTVIAQVSPTNELTPSTSPTPTPVEKENSPTPTTSPSPTPATKPNEPSVVSEHIVTSGDTLWAISQKYYGTGYEWSKIAKENNIENPNKIEVGQTLKIPATGKTTAIDTKVEYTKYTVQKGDSLWKIAQSELGNANLWVEIAKINKLKNPSIIHAGNVLEIPKK